MTKLLALDTSTDACSVAVLSDGKLTEKLVLEPRSHARLCLPMVDALLAETGFKLGDLDAIAFGRGPGSFTGVRIAAGLVQGLGFAHSLPVIPVSTLQAMALQFAMEAERGQASRVEAPHSPLWVMPLLDARMNEVYHACYELHFNSSNNSSKPVITEYSAEAVSAPEKLICPPEPFTLVGSGLTYLERLPETFARGLSTKKDLYPRAGAVALLAEGFFGEGRYIAAEEAQPTYLRNEVSWKKLKEQ